jgi:glycosyltransferase involved in cell wall biosynthesis
VVQHGETGYLDEIGDVDAMATHAVELLSDESKYEAFRTAAIDRAKLFHPDIVVSQYEDLYMRTIEGRNPYASA